MLKTVTLLGTALAMSAAAIVPATPAAAQRWDRGYDYDRGYDRGYGYDRGFDRRDWRGPDRRYIGRRGQHPCKDGDGGTAIGAIAGGVAGHQIAGRFGDRTLGAILGGAVGALAGRAIDRADPPRGCVRSR